MQLDTFVPGQPTWFDLSTTDLDAAAAFYAGLVGWVYEAGDNEQRYGEMKLGDAGVCGIQPMPMEGMPPFWTVYLYAVDTAAALERVTAHGGAVLMPAEDVGDGSFGIAADPAGAVFGIWDGPGSQEWFEPGTYAWAEATVRDRAQVADFYPAVFEGLTRVDVDMGSPYTMYTAGELGAFGVMQMDDNWPADVPAHWLLYLHVADCDAAVAYTEANGGTVVTPAFDAPPGRIAVIRDPQGAGLAVMTPAEGFDPLG